MKDVCCASFLSIAGARCVLVILDLSAVCIAGVLQFCCVLPKLFLGNMTEPCQCSQFNHYSFKTCPPNQSEEVEIVRIEPRVGIWMLLKKKKIERNKKNRTQKKIELNRIKQKFRFLSKSVPIIWYRFAFKENLTSLPKKKKWIKLNRTKPNRIKSTPHPTLFSSEHILDSPSNFVETTRKCEWISKAPLQQKKMAAALAPSPSLRFNPYSTLRLLSFYPRTPLPCRTPTPIFPPFLPRLSRASAVPRRRSFCTLISAALHSGGAAERTKPEIAEERRSEGGNNRVGAFRKKLKVVDVKGGSDEGLERLGQSLVVMGWVRTLRVQSNVTFIEVIATA